MNRKGITPVVATVLLITITVAATGTAWTFLFQTQETITDNYEEKITQQKREDQSSINIEYVYNSSGGYTVLNVRNTGSYSLPVEEDGFKEFSLYVNGRPVNGDSKSWKYYKSRSPPVVLDPSELLSINSTEKFPDPGKSVNFKLVGPYETSDSHVCLSSGSNNC